ncbi:MAG: class I SAM-dependent RNA methyltransferase, partial [Flavobacteriaceae bacterium]|nr:class I SAM-dependent RNA methyltransferase [Flavobacteriaceae bacterium]
MSENYEMVAKTLFGFEEILAEELLRLGAQDIKKGVRHVSFYGDKGFMYKANLALRTAIKVLKPIKSFKVFNEDDLYRKTKNLRWEDYLNETGSLAVDATVHSQQFTHSKYVALKVKDAIVDRFREQTGTRPDVDLLFPDLKINIHIDRQF